MATTVVPIVPLGLDGTFVTAYGRQSGTSGWGDSLDPLKLVRLPSLIALTRCRAKLAIGLVNRPAAFRRPPTITSDWLSVTRPVLEIRPATGYRVCLPTSLPRRRRGSGEVITRGNVASDRPCGYCRERVCLDHRRPRYSRLTNREALYAAQSPWRAPDQDKEMRP